MGPPSPRPCGRPRAPRAPAIFALLSIGLAALVPSPAAAQPIPQQIPPGMRGADPAEVLRMLQASGVSQAEIRQRLEQMGLDPAMADPYFDQLSGLPAGVSGAQGEFAQGLSRMGLYGNIPDSIPVDSVTGAFGPSDPFLSIAPYVIFADEERLKPDSMRVFGREVFRRGSGRVSALRAGPVPPDYRLGPGDEVYLILTGDVEAAHTMRVSREGALVIPDVGTLFVNGLTMSGLEDVLRGRLAQVYSGVPEGTTRVDVSMGRLRMNQVFVVGEVEAPGTYEVPATATALTALYQAGGPAENGSFRNVEVRRGGEVVARLDLYEYLLSGEAGGGIRLEQGDVIFVPVVGAQVRVAGEARRPMFYEALPSDRLVDVLSYAGGPEPEADLNRIQIDRILPPELREAGRERVIERVDLVEALRSGEHVPVLPGDLIRLFPIGEERRDRVVVEGFVRRPGEYELRPGMTVTDALRQAGGLRPEAFAPVAHVSRLNPADSTFRLIRVDLDGGGDDGAGRLQLEDQDRIEVFGRSTLATPRRVRIIGAVKEPGSYPYREGMTVEDLILSAGGFVEGAQGLEAEVSRMEPRVSRSDTVSSSFRVRLADRLPWSLEERVGRPQFDDDLPRGDEVPLRAQDQVFVRQLPGYVEPTAVEVAGEVNAPGSYAFTVREEPLSSFVARAGGLTDDAFADGARLVRDSTLVAIDLERALRDPGSEYDVVLRPDDLLEIPRYDPTVLVEGAVAFESRLVYDEDLTLADYLDRAGGLLPEADDDRISVRYASGERATTKKTLWFERYPEVEPGSTIIVPTRAAGSGTNWAQVLTTTVSIMSATATLILAIQSIK